MAATKERETGGKFKRRIDLPLEIRRRDMVEQLFVLQHIAATLTHLRQIWPRIFQREREPREAFSDAETKKKREPSEPRERKMQRII